MNDIDNILVMVRKLVENDCQNTEIVTNLATVVKDLIVRIQNLEKSSSLNKLRSLDPQEGPV